MNPTAKVSSSEQRLLECVQANMQPTKALNAALRDGLAALRIPIDWREAGVLAEAVRGHYEQVIQVYRVVHPLAQGLMDDGERERMQLDLLMEAHKAGLALVSKPVETRHALSDLKRVSSPVPATRETAQELLRMYPLGDPSSASLYSDCQLVLLTGHCRRLAEAS